jgi:hypothetical protein
MNRWRVSQTIEALDHPYLHPMNIDLRINKTAFSLGEALDSRKLGSAKLEKQGLLNRLVRQLMTPLPSGQILHWAKNCEITCFKGKFGLWANLDRSSGSANMAGTSAFLYFKHLVLEKVTFQVLLNGTMAMGGVAAFQELCKKRFGSRSSDSPASWQDSEAIVLCNLHHTRDKAIFMWMTRRYMEEHGP